VCPRKEKKGYDPRMARYLINCHGGGKAKFNQKGKKPTKHGGNSIHTPLNESLRKKGKTDHRASGKEKQEKGRQAFCGTKSIQTLGVCR